MSVKLHKTQINAILSISTLQSVNHREFCRNRIGDLTFYYIRCKLSLCIVFLSGGTSKQKNDIENLKHCQIFIF